MFTLDPYKVITITQLILFILYIGTSLFAIFLYLKLLLVLISDNANVIVATSKK